MAPGVLAHDFFERAQVQARRDQQLEAAVKALLPSAK